MKESDVKRMTGNGWSIFKRPRRSTGNPASWWLNHRKGNWLKLSSGMMDKLEKAERVRPAPTQPPGLMVLYDYWPENA